MTIDQEDLLRKAQLTIAAAAALHADGYTDSAVSRAYYAMFYVAQALLLEQGLTFSKHGSLLAAFGQHLVKTGRAPAHFHRYLIDAYNARVTGDYKAKSNLLPADAARLIQQAEEFVALADQMLRTSAPTQSVPAIPDEGSEAEPQK